jgi:hypothetical protein
MRHAVLCALFYQIGGLGVKRDSGGFGAISPQREAAGGSPDRVLISR